MAGSGPSPHSAARLRRTANTRGRPPRPVSSRPAPLVLRAAVVPVLPRGSALLLRSREPGPGRTASIRPRSRARWNTRAYPGCATTGINGARASAVTQVYYSETDAPGPARSGPIPPRSEPGPGAGALQGEEGAEVSGCGGCRRSTSARRLRTARCCRPERLQARGGGAAAMRGETS